MGIVADQMGADFILALGDNFYYRGVDSVDSPRFKVSCVEKLGEKNVIIKRLSLFIYSVSLFNLHIRKRLRRYSLQSLSKSPGT